MNPEIVGYIGSIISTVSFLPQVIKVYSTKQTRDISYSAFALFGTGNIIWTTYGVMTNSFPVIVANILIFILVMIIILLKFQYEKKK